MCLSPLSFSGAVLIWFSFAQLFATPWTAATRCLCPWDSPGRNTAWVCHALLQWTFLTQGLNLGSYVTCINRQALYHSSTWEAQKYYMVLQFHCWIYSKKPKQKHLIIKIYTPHVYGSINYNSQDMKAICVIKHMNG